MGQLVALVMLLSKELIFEMAKTCAKKLVESWIKVKHHVKKHNRFSK